MELVHTLCTFLHIYCSLSFWWDYFCYCCYGCFRAAIFHCLFVVLCSVNKRDAPFCRSQKYQSLLLCNRLALGFTSYFQVFCINLINSLWLACKLFSDSQLLRARISYMRYLWFDSAEVVTLLHVTSTCYWGWITSLRYLLISLGGLHKFGVYAYV